jgi:molybdopterin biosynthesis enzyme
MGETDVVEHVLVERLKGQLHFGRMNMKPGKPTTFVTIPSTKGTRLVFAMPGNPVSATVCTQLLVRPCLDLLFCRPDSSADTDGDSVKEYTRRVVMNSWVHPEVQFKYMRRIVMNAWVHPEVQVKLAHISGIINGYTAFVAVNEPA